MAHRKAHRKASGEAADFQQRFDAACALVARKYCDMFEFWRDCRYKPCRSARRCVGDQGFCLQSRCWDIPYDAGVAAHLRMIAALPPGADSYMVTAHHRPPTSLCLHDPKNQKMRRKAEAKAATTAATKAATNAATTAAADRDSAAGPKKAAAPRFTISAKDAAAFIKADVEAYNAARGNEPDLALKDWT